MSKTRIATGLASLAIGVGGVSLALLTPAADPADPALSSVEGTARAVSLACGPDFENTMGETTAGIGGEDSTDLVRTRTIVVSGGDASLAGTTIESEGADNLRSSFESGAFPGELRVEPGDEAALATGTTQRFQDRGELAGMAMTPCVAPATEQFLVGGATSASSSSQLVLTNVSGSPATVNIDVYTSTGEAAPSILSSTTVDAYSSETLLVEAGARDARLAFRITSTGGEVAAQLLTHEVDGIVGSGVETVSPGAAPSQRVVVPGADLSGENGDVSLRVANPGSETATVSVLSATTDGTEEVPGSQDVALAPGTVLDLSMDGLGGDWSALIVDADRPVLAAARVDLEGDFAWLASGEPVTNGVVTIPDSESYVTLYSAEPTGATITFYDHLGAEVEETEVDVDEIATVASPDSASHAVVEADAGVYAGILSVKELETITGIAGLTLTIPPAGSSDLELQVIN